MTNKTEEQLIERYKEIYSNNGQPKGMFLLKPGIPFVGNKYSNTTPKVLSYASAENLSYAYDENLEPNYSEIIHHLDEKQFNRARYFYNHDNADFPSVHIQPFDNGSQLLITRHILTQLGHSNIFKDSPYDFIEQISVANPGKFSIAEKPSADYASDKYNMAFSVDYIREDLTNLKPEIIIIPKTVFETVNKIVKWDILLSEAAIKNAYFIKIYQLSFFNNHRIENQIKGLSRPNKDDYLYGEWLDKIDCGRVNVDAHFSWVHNELYTITNVISS